jgi:uncharacterized membrane protein YfcA
MYTSPLNVLLIVAVGAATGVLGAVLGTGGGVFLVPVLVLGFGVPVHYAVAASIVTVIATSSAVASTNVERGTANMRLGMTLEIATSLGAIAGGLAAGWLPAHVLEGLFGLVLLPAAALMWRGRSAEGGSGEAAGDRSQESRVRGQGSAVGGQGSGARGQEVGVRGQGSTQHSAFSIQHSAFSAQHSALPTGALGSVFYDEGERRLVAYRVRRLPAGFGISFVAGGVSGLLGIGGGVFKVPALNLVCRIPIKAAAATSNFMIGVTAAASAFLYYGRGEVRPALSAATVLGVLAGSALGSVLNRRVRGRQVRRLFAAMLVAVAIEMLYRAWLAGAVAHG